MNRPLDYQLNTPKWEEVKNYLLNKAIIIGDTVAGKKYGWFLDTREALLDSGYLNDIAEMMWFKIRKYRPEVLFGRGYGAMPLLMALQIVAERENYRLKILICRETRKDHNRQKLIEGPKVGILARAIYVDDACNSGETYLKTVEALKQEKISLNVLAHTYLFDFWGYKGSRRRELLGIPVERLYTRHDLGLTRIDALTPSVGEVVWRNLSCNQWPQWFKCPPKIYNDKLFFATDKHEVFCHDLATGNIIWKWQGPRPYQDKGIVGELTIFENRIFISSYDGNLYCLEHNTGNKLWSVKLDHFLHSTPWIDAASNEIYIATEGGIENKRGDIVALDLTTGFEKWRVKTGHVVPASPIKLGRFIVCGSNDGYLYGIIEGKIVWKLNIGIFKGRANVIDNVIVVTSDNGRIYGIDFEGNIIWNKGSGTQSRHQFLPVNQELGLVYVLNEDGNVLAFDKFGNTVWATTIRGIGSWGISLKENELFVNTESGHLVSLDVKTGKKLSNTFLKTPVHCPIDFDNNFIAVHTVTKGLIVYKRGYYV